MDASRARWVLLTTILLAAGCGRFHVRPPVAARPIAFAAIEVVIAETVPGDRHRMLARLRVPEEMQLALRTSYPAGPGPVVRVTITEFRSGRYDVTRMHAVVDVVGDNQLLNRFEVDSTSMAMSSRGGRIEAVAQDCVDQIAQQL